MVGIETLTFSASSGAGILAGPNQAEYVVQPPSDFQGTRIHHALASIKVPFIYRLLIDLSREAGHAHKLLWLSASLCFGRN